MFSTNGFFWEGFFRALQGDITGLVLSLIFLVAILLVARAAIRRLDGRPDLRRSALLWTNRAAAALVMVCVGGFVLHAALVASANRIPRSDVDKSGVYKQMDSHLSAPDHPH